MSEENKNNEQITPKKKPNFLCVAIAWFIETSPETKKKIFGALGILAVIIALNMWDNSLSNNDIQTQAADEGQASVVTTTTTIPDGEGNAVTTQSDDNGSAETTASEAGNGTTSVAVTTAPNGSEVPVVVTTTAPKTSQTVTTTKKAVTTATTKSTINSTSKTTTKATTKATAKITTNSTKLKVACKEVSSWKQNGVTYTQYDFTITNISNASVPSWKVILNSNVNINVDYLWAECNYTPSGKAITITPKSQYLKTIQRGGKVGFRIQVSSTKKPTVTLKVQ